MSKTLFQELRQFYQSARLATTKPSNKQHDSENNVDGPAAAAVTAVSDRNKKNADRSVVSDNSDNSDNYTIPYGEKARNAGPDSSNNPSMFNKVEWGPSLQWSEIHIKTL